MAICTGPMCADGKVAVEQARRVFNILSGNPAFNRAKFEPTLLGIEQTFEDNYSMFSVWIPFNPYCCTIEEIGRQADQLTIDMQNSVGVSVVEPTPRPVDSLDTMVTLGMLALGAVILGNVSAAIRR